MESLTIGDEIMELQDKIERIQWALTRNIDNFPFSQTDIENLQITLAEKKIKYTKARQYEETFRISTFRGTGVNDLPSPVYSVVNGKGDYLHKDGTLQGVTKQRGDGDDLITWSGYYSTKEEAQQHLERYLNDRERAIKDGSG